MVAIALLLNASGTQMPTWSVTNGGIHCGVAALALKDTSSSTTSTTYVTRALTQVETWELDHGYQQWPADAAIPIAWLEDDQPQQVVELAATPINPGVISLLYVQLATTLTGAGVALSIPDDWTPYILWGTLAELLSSDGQAFDPLRAQYCSRRYEEGVELARVVLGGTW